MEYLLKSSAVILIFYIFYKLLLQRETFFHINRFYLLAGILISVFIPFMVIPIYIEYTPAAIDSIIPLTATIEDSQNANEMTFDYWRLIYFFYGVGGILFLGKLLIELTSLKLLVKKHQYHKNGSCAFIETEDDIPPFSFFNWIVYNPNKYSENELNHILNHEKVHVKELHSIDVLLAQITCVILWFNPFVWLFKKEVEQNLEFIADKKAQVDSACKKSYQLILLKSSVSKHKFLITNNFYNSQIKKRIIMLHKSKSKKLNAWKYVLIVPMLALFLMSFNTKEILVEIENPIHDDSGFIQNETSDHQNNVYEELDFNEAKQNSLTKPKVVHKVISQPIANVIPANVENTPKAKKDISVTVITKKTTDSELELIKENLKKEGLTVKFKGIKRNKKGEIRAIKIDAKSEKSNTNYQISSDDETIEPIHIVYDSEKNSISIGNGKAHHGENSFVFKSKDGNHNIHRSGNAKHVFVFSDENEDNDVEHKHDTLYVVRNHDKDGKLRTIKSSREVKVISDDDTVIEIMIDDENDNEVIKKEKIIIKSVNNGKNVWVKDIDSNEEKIIILGDDDEKNKIFISGDNGKNPLFIIDGKETTKEDMSKLSPDDIESINVLKGKGATEKYGDKGKDGVIIITTKKE